MRKDIEKIKERLEAFDKSYETGPNLSKRLRAAERKYSGPFQDILFTI